MRRPPNPKRDRASDRNLEALRKGLDGQDGQEEEEMELVDAQKDPILRKIVDMNRPPVILSLERPPSGADGVGVRAIFLGSAPPMLAFTSSSSIPFLLLSLLCY